MVTAMAFTVSIALAAVAGLMVGFYYGYETGVSETERRWSDAVAKAEDRRKYG